VTVEKVRHGIDGHRVGLSGSHGLIPYVVSRRDHKHSERTARPRCHQSWRMWTAASPGALDGQ
jgi:hypothetical protein